MYVGFFALMRHMQREQTQLQLAEGVKELTQAIDLQAIDAAIEMGLSRVEAGAQGEHKIQRGYVPSLTYSSHYFPDASMRSVVNNFLQRESMQIDYTLEALTLEAPFKPNAEGTTVDMPV